MILKTVCMRLARARVQLSRCVSPLPVGPACWYGLPEFDLAQSRELGATSHSAFSDAYFAVLPKRDGFEARERLFLLVRALNTLNQLGVIARSAGRGGEGGGGGGCGGGCGAGGVGDGDGGGGGDGGDADGGIQRQGRALKRVLDLMEEIVSAEI
eukprot:6064550-Pleurochrysis_carterae.AAC.3